jgi:colanic acid biosynthesis glycosyl transferase WcaI
MKILVLSQVFYPDTVSVAQHLSDLCFALAKRGHSVDVLTSRYPYEEKNYKYKSEETINSVNVIRIWGTGFGKANNISRIIDFLSFNFSVFFNLCFIKKFSYDLIIGLTAPPLLSYIGSLIAKRKQMKFCYWIMDMQPELAIKSGIVKKDSIIAKILLYFGNSILQNSDKIIVLDRFMEDYLVRNRNVTINKVFIVPVWPAMFDQFSGARMENPFRVENNFQDKIVLMYSGNHSVVHPLDTILSLAKMLNDDKRFLFVFIGGGVRKKDVSEFKKENDLDNIIQLPFQPREKIHISLGSSDFQVVVLGEGQVGFTHPNKITGALFIGKPIIYIGPPESHIGDLLSDLPGNISVDHGESDLLMVKLLDLCKDMNMVEETGRKNQAYALNKFSPEVLIDKLCRIIERD